MIIPECKKNQGNNLTYKVANCIAMILKPCSTIGLGEIFSIEKIKLLMKILDSSKYLSK